MIYSLVRKTAEDGGWTGTARFDAMLRRVFPDLKSITTVPGDLHPNDIVITDNHLSLEVPEQIRTVVVHHGCAATHFARDRAWSIRRNLDLVKMQQRMFGLAGRTFVAPSSWVAREMARQCVRTHAYAPKLIPHWVDPIPANGRNGKPVIIGDWRDHNKGSDVWKAIAARFPEWEFQPLDFNDDEGRRKQYGSASLYLCLSLSEGGAYSVCDAEAAGLPIVTTNVGNFQEFPDCEVIDWQYRDDPGIVGAAIKRKLGRGRAKPSFYEGYSFENWKHDWEAVVQ